MSFRSGEVFCEILRFVYPKHLNADMAGLHQTFYALMIRFPEIMGKFQFKKIGNPFSITLEKLLTLYELAGVLRLVRFDPRTYEIDPDKLAKFDRNQKLLSLLSEQGDLNTLCA